MVQQKLGNALNKDGGKEKRVARYGVEEEEKMTWDGERADRSPTCGHEEGDTELATEDPCSQIL